MTDPTPRPEPVKQLVALGSLVSAAVIAVGGTVTLITARADLSTVATSIGGAVVAVGSLVAFVAPYVAALRARKLVTPLAAPRNDDGVALVDASFATYGKHSAPTDDQHEGT